jgi:NapH/MauN family ferredoxin-type protein
MAEQSNLNFNMKNRQSGIQGLLRTQTIRRVVQSGVALFILFLVVQHIVIGEAQGAATPSAEAFCPFGGLETLYKYITSGGTFVSHTHLSNMVILVAVLAISLLFRSAFCGWICPLGFLQDLVNKFSKLIQKRFPTLRKSLNSFQKQNAWLAVVDRYLRYLKYLVLVWAIGGAAVYGYMVFRDFDPWSALLNIVEFSFTPGLVVLIVLLIASLFVERPWCRYACPLGAINGLVGKLSPFHIRREESACTNCKICSRSCPMGLNVHSATAITSPDCISCLECVDSCPRNGALEVRLDYPLSGK